MSFWKQFKPKACSVNLKAGQKEDLLAELVENLFNSLAAALARPSNQLAFLRAEGIELMLITLKERKYAARGALQIGRAHV